MKNLKFKLPALAGLVAVSAPVLADAPAEFASVQTSVTGLIGYVTPVIVAIGMAIVTLTFIRAILRKANGAAKGRAA